MITYATSTDLATWVTPVPDNADALLRSATRLVAVAANLHPYSDPVPTGSTAVALADATCAQVAAWLAAKIDPVAGVASESAPIKRSELLDGKVEYDTSVAAAARADAARDLAAEARSILTIAGLLYVPVPLFDDTGALDTWGLDVPYRRTVPINSESQRTGMDADDYDLDGGILDGGNPFNEFGA